MGGGLYCAELARDWTSPHTFRAVASFTPSNDQTIEDLAREHVTMLRSAQPDGPYHLGGYCHGGVLAYEMARQLEDAGETVAFLFIVDVPSLNTHLRWLRRTADVLGAALGWSERERRDRFVAWRKAQHYRLTVLASWSPLAAVRHFASRAPHVIRRRLRRPLRRQPDAAPRASSAGAHPGVGTPPDEFQVMDALYRGVLAAYLPGPYRGSMTLGVSSATLAGQGARLAVEGWRRLVAGRMTVAEIPGDHTSMRSGAGARVMRQLLDDALGAPPPAARR